MKSFKQFFKEDMPVKGFVSNDKKETKSKLNTLDYDLANFPFSPFSSDSYQKGVDNSIRPYAAYTWGFGTKPASSQQELDWEQANREKQEIRKQKTSLPGTVDVERSSKVDLPLSKNNTKIYKKPRNDLISMRENNINELSVPQGTTGEKKNWNPPMVGIRMANGKIEKHPPGKSGSSGGGNGGE
jgi:hypothetical protein